MNPCSNRLMTIFACLMLSGIVAKSWGPPQLEGLAQLLQLGAPLGLVVVLDGWRPNQLERTLLRVPVLPAGWALARAVLMGLYGMGVALMGLDAVLSMSFTLLILVSSGTVIALVLIVLMRSWHVVLDATSIAVRNPLLRTTTIESPPERVDVSDWQVVITAADGRTVGFGRQLFIPRSEWLQQWSKVRQHLETLRSAEPHRVSQS